MGVNYLHNFTGILDDALKKYNGISKALELDNPDDFYKEESYKDKVVEFRKNLRTRRLITITDIMDVLKEFITEDTLTLYSIEKAFNFVKQYEGSQKSIKSIMNKFDKTLRSTINKDILNQFNIEASVRRTSQYGKENDDSFKLVNKLKSNERSHPWYDKTSKAPEWNIDIKIPIPHIRVTGEVDGDKVDVKVPYERTQQSNREVLESPYVDLHIKYKFDSFTEFFINSIDKLDDYSKDINLFTKDLMDANERRLSYHRDARKSLNGRRSHDHPYYDTSNWCMGELQPELEGAYSSMNITDIALSTHRWLTTYDINRTQPHNNINQFYNWLPSTAGTNVDRMRHTDRQVDRCWSAHRSKTICENRKCAFIDTCYKYNEEHVEESSPLTDDPLIHPNIHTQNPGMNIDIVQFDLSLEGVRNSYVTQLASIYSLPDIEYANLIEERDSYQYSDGMALSDCIVEWKNSTNVELISDLSNMFIGYILTYTDSLIPIRGVNNQQPLNEGPL